MDKTILKDAKVDAASTMPPDSSEDRAYDLARINEMVTARNVRETPHDEFDGMTYIQRCEANRKLANTFIQPKKNKEDTNYQGGTVRQKLNTYLSYLNNISIDAEVRAFDDKNVEDVSLGSSLSDIIQDSNVHDKDEEKRLYRQYVLLEQGEVFIEEIWHEYYETVKDVKVAFDGTNFKEVSWDERSVMKEKGATRRILLNENVYLGDITIMEIEDQPFIFTVEQVDRSVAEQMYGTWERWKYVPKTIKFLDQPILASLYNQNFSLTEVQKNQCEIVKYQCKVRNEFAIYINGVRMTPVGLPIPRKWGASGDEVHYNVTKQILGIISPFFAYGKGIPAVLKVKAYILDEMNRLAILKTQGSFQPARWNMTGTVLSNRIFMPGKIANGLDGSKIGTLTDINGMTRSELQMIQYIQKGIDDDAAPAAAIQGTFAGAGNRISATQVQAMKSQAELMMVLTLFAATNLEIKLGTLRLYNILENFFDPIDVQLNEAKNGLVKKYRSVSVDKQIPGFGQGQSVIDVTDQPMSAGDINMRREQIETRTGKPTILSVINRDVLKSLYRYFYVTALPKPKKNSDLTKVLFNDMLNQARTFPNLNNDYMAERFAAVWGEDPSKMFVKGQSAGGQTEDMATGQPGARGKLLNKKVTGAGRPVTQPLGEMVK